MLAAGEASETASAFSVRLIIENYCHASASRTNNEGSTSHLVACSDKIYRVETLASLDGDVEPRDGSKHKRILLVF
jgi:hypothetical protein